MAHWIQTPATAGYGVSVSTPDGVLCAGGSDASNIFVTCSCSVGGTEK